jgi:hypothetical protein
MKKEQIITYLKECGFCIQEKSGIKNKNGDLTTRLEHPSIDRRGSLYVADDYLSATGPFKNLKEQIKESDLDHLKYPIWKGHALTELLTELTKTFSKP